MVNGCKRLINRDRQDGIKLRIKNAKLRIDLLNSLEWGFIR